MMAARKKTGTKRGSENGGAGMRAFGVVVEQMRSELRVVSEAVLGLDARMTAGFQDIKHDISELKGDVSSLKCDVSGLKSDVSGLKSDVSGLKAELSRVTTDLSLVKVAVLETNREVKMLRGAVEDLDARKADRAS